MLAVIWALSWGPGLNTYTWLFHVAAWLDWLRSKGKCPDTERGEGTKEEGSQVRGYVAFYDLALRSYALLPHSLY